MKRKILLTIIFVFSIMLGLKGVDAASASLSASKTSVTVGTKVTITVKVNAAAWNLAVSGSATDSIVGFNMDDQNQTTTKTYTISTSKAGTYTVYLNGDITEAGSETANNVSKSVTITVKEKPADTTNNTNTNTNTNNNTNANKNNNTTTTNKNNTTTTTKKSSNANISSLRLSVEGFKFTSGQTTYNIKVGEDVNNITASVTLAHSKAVYSISGNKNLKAGNNVMKIVVTAEDGTTKTYKINVEKAGNFEETSSELTNLIIEDMTFNTPFAATTTEYNGGQIKYTEKLNVLPYTRAEQAKVEILNNENLKVGDNTVVIKVTSKDKTSTTEYKVTFTMLAKEETNALVEVKPYDEVNEKEENKKSNWTGVKDTLKNNATIILLYLLALVEFAQVVYLYVQLKSVNPSAVEVRRRNKTKDSK